MNDTHPESGRQQLAEWQLNQQQLGVFLAVGGGTHGSMRVRVKKAARHLVTLGGQAVNLALWINDARFENGPVDLFLSPTLPPKQVIGLSVYLKKGAWAFLFELDEKEHSGFGIERAEPDKTLLEPGSADEEEEMAETYS